MPPPVLKQWAQSLVTVLPEITLAAMRTSFVDIRPPP
jgi:hypothetical protein